MSLDLDRAIVALAEAVVACGRVDPTAARVHLRAAAGHAQVFLDVPGVTHGSLRLVQEYALVAAKALTTVRSPPALRPDHGEDAARRAETAIVAAWEVVSGRRSS